MVHLFIAIRSCTLMQGGASKAVSQVHLSFAVLTTKSPAAADIGENSLLSDCP
jgi:hypothetical protein